MTEQTLKPKTRPGTPRSAARLAAVQALYQIEMGEDAVARVIKEFHDHRLGSEIEGDTYIRADRNLFDDIVSGAWARRSEVDQLIAGHLAEGWTLDRLDRPMRQILRAGTYELLARPDVPTAVVITEYVDVAHAFYEPREAAFVNGLLDRVSSATGRKAANAK
ncbi:transcription antitermination factor NusB [Pedomonas mirosovicensis]|uniref:transcription antitermination factor NusB n=1 Tax=Pedomonas mirosovicensis TaxID=2908641 RepID=UPI002167E81C|nr:transcription antitermination factor NusB [Pedomonas mirosovicensis]MCH8685456.1 transcription antitermination factor NusB [Pedomonas mirosovicensis]